jgi:hypothetical protein
VGSAVKRHQANEDVDAVHDGSLGVADTGQAADHRRLGRAADRLGLVAAPTFVLLAYLTGIADEGTMGTSCPTTSEPMPWSSMALMYGLMGVFHAGPWLRWLGRRWSPGGRI